MPCHRERLFAKRSSTCQAWDCFSDKTASQWQVKLIEQRLSLCGFTRWHDPLLTWQFILVLSNYLIVIGHTPPLAKHPLRANSTSFRCIWGHPFGYASRRLGGGWFGECYQLRKNSGRDEENQQPTDVLQRQGWIRNCSESEIKTKPGVKLAETKDLSNYPKISSR